MLKTRGSWYPRDVIVQAVYLKLRFSLSYRDVEEILKDRGLGVRIKIRQSKYLNNTIEQDHRFIKRLTKPKLGCKSLEAAAITLAGIEVVRMLRKSQLHSELSKSRSVPEQFRLLAA